MRERINWWKIADGNWHPVDTTRSRVTRWRFTHGYQAQTSMRDGVLHVRFTPSGLSFTPTEELRLRLADAAEGRYPEPPRGVDLNPQQWFILLEASRDSEGSAWPIRSHLHESTIKSLIPRYLSGFHWSLTPEALRILGRDAEADHLVSVGARCLADLTDRTFVPTT